MQLATFQESIGGLVRSTGDPVEVDPLLTALTQSAGFQFTLKVQRSWRAGRAKKSAYHTLSILPPDEREALVSAWLDCGGGLFSFSGAESHAFLAFIAERLPERSHALSICQFESAALLAAEGAARFEVPELSVLRLPGCRLRPGRYAGIVKFWGMPEREETAVLFGPGLDGLQRIVSAETAAVFERFSEPLAVEVLFEEGWTAEAIGEWLSAGFVEYTTPIISGRDFYVR